MVVRVSVHLSPRARWTSLFLLSSIFVTLTWVLPFLDQHYPIESGEFMTWPSARLSRIAGSRATERVWSPTTQVHNNTPTEGGRRDTAAVLNGPPMKFFRDNLRNDTYYLTTWSMAGFTNEFINYVNMIYLAILTDRVPIIPPFAPDHHIPTSAGILPFGDLFDLDALSDYLRVPVLEWRDVKELPTSSDRNPFPYVDRPVGNDPRPEPLGCWSTRAPIEREPIRAENVIHHIGVDPAYTRVPFYTRLTDDPGELHVVFPRLAALIYRSSTFSSASRSMISPSWEHWGDPEKEPDRFEHMAPAVSGHHRRPESHLTCFDTLYYMTSGAEVFEWRLGFSPVWRNVGRWLRFNARTHELVKEYVADLFGSSPDHGDHVYPFIAVHIRRGDFSMHCGDGHCYPALSVYAKQVEEVKKEIYKTRGINVEHVVVTANEESPTFWDEVGTLGWLRIDHLRHRTVERYGIWYPVVIDVVVQSYALGLVGTEDSTFSMVSQLRVLDEERRQLSVQIHSPPLSLLMVLSRVDSRTPLQPTASLGVMHHMSFVESIARKPRQRTVLISLVTLVALTTYIFIANITFLLPPALRHADAPALDTFTVALESIKNSVPVGGGFAHRKKIGQSLRLSLDQELAALSSFIASLPQNVIPHSVDPTRPLDPQLVLDFDINSPRAKDELRAMVEDVWSRNPVFLYAKHFSSSSREVKAILSGLNLWPEPTVIDVDTREDKVILVPMLARLTSIPQLPVLIVGGKVVGSTKEIRSLFENEELQTLITASGSQVNGGRKKKHRR